MRQGPTKADTQAEFKFDSTERRLTQRDKVLAFLKRHGKMTDDDARDLGIKRLASRVDELRKRGHFILTNMVSGKNADGQKCRWGEYIYHSSHAGRTTFEVEK